MGRGSKGTIETALEASIVVNDKVGGLVRMEKRVSIERQGVKSGWVEG